MNDITYIVFAVCGVAVAAALPLLAYARLPHESLNQVSEHGRFRGLTAHESAKRPSGNQPASRIRSFQGQPA
jgi:hypothetical protein